MLELQTILQNAIEDYLTALDRPITIDDAQEICSFELASVFWKAFNLASATLNSSQQYDPVINGVKQSKAKATLETLAQNLFNNTVAKRYQNLKQLFLVAERYGFKFGFGTKDMFHTSLPMYSEEDNRIITSYSFTKK